MQSMSDDDISSLCTELLRYRQDVLQRFADDMGIEKKKLLRYKLPTTSKSWHKITPGELSTLIGLVISKHHDTLRTTHKLSKAWRTGFDVLDPQGHVVDHHGSYNWALEVADSIGGSVRPLRAQDNPHLTPEQELRHRWRRAIYSRDDWDLDELSASTGYCTHYVVRMGVEYVGIGCTPSNYAVEAVEALAA